MGDSQLRFKNRVEISFAVSFIDPSETQGMCTFWQKNRYSFRLEKSSRCSAKQGQTKKINGYE